jgi:hypothetical protein
MPNPEPHANTPAAAPPPVIPVGGSDWRPADARWLAGGKRLHFTLGLLAVLILAVPLYWVDQSLPDSYFSLSYYWPPSRASRDDWVPPAQGVHWRWSVLGWVEGPSSGKSFDVSVSCRCWMTVVLPSATGVLVIVSLFLAPKPRSLTCLLAGMLMMHGGAMWDWGGWLPTYGIWPDWIGPQGFPGTLLFWMAGPWLLAASAARAIARGPNGPLLHVVGILLPVLLWFVSVGLTSLIFLPSEGWEALWGTKDTAFSHERTLEYVARGFRVLRRLAPLVFGLLGIMSAVCRSRGIAAGIVFCFAAIVGLLLAVGVVEHVQLSIYIVQRSGGTWDRMLNWGQAIHSMLPGAIGLVLVVGSAARLWVLYLPGDGRPAVPSPAQPPASRPAPAGQTGPAQPEPPPADARED